MFDKQTIRAMVIGLEAFKGHDPEEYYDLVEPLSEFIFCKEFYNMSEVNKLVKDILSARSETTKTMQSEPSVTAQFLADQIKTEVESIRQRLFDSKSAPFNSIEDAQAWCNEARKRTEEWEKRTEECVACWRAELEKNPLMRDRLFFKDKIPIDVLPQEELAQREKINGYYNWLGVGKPPEQDKQSRVFIVLWHHIFDIVKATGFTMESVKMYILADTSPVLPTYTFRILRETQPLLSGASVVNRFARVTIRGDLTFEDLRSLYRGIRRELGIKRSKRPTTKHLQLYQMVQQKGAIPSGRGTVAFWRSVMKEWNDLHKQDKYNRWQDVKGAYERIIARFERRIITKEAQNERSHNKEIQE